MTFSVQELADRVAGQVEGDPSQLISGVAPVLSAGPQELTYVMGARYLRHLTDSQAAAVLVGTDVEVSPNGKTFIRVEQPELAFSTLLDVFYPAPEIVDGVHPTAVVGSGVTIGRGVHVGEYAVIANRVTLGARTSVGAHTYVGRGVSIGEDCRLDPGCSVMEGAMIGDRVRIRCGARISSDGFGFTDGPTGAVKLKQVGKCVIGDDVEIGANTTDERQGLRLATEGRPSPPMIVGATCQMSSFGPYALAWPRAFTPAPCTERTRRVASGDVASRTPYSCTEPSIAERSMIRSSERARRSTTWFKSVTIAGLAGTASSWRKRG